MEESDLKLFDSIAADYSKKDIYPVSSLARRAQLFTMINLIGRQYFRNVLDLGCGPGFNSFYLKDIYEKYTGIDYSSNFIDIAKKIHKKGNFIQGNVKELHLLFSEEYDIIMGVGVLHHIDDLGKAFSSIKTISGRNTIKAFIEPQNGNPIVQLLRRIRKRLDKSYSKDQIFFTKEELTELMKSHGFEIIKIKYQGYFSTPFAQVILKPAFLFFPICKLAVLLDDLIFRYFNNSWSWNIIVIVK